MGKRRKMFRRKKSRKTSRWLEQMGADPEQTEFVERRERKERTNVHHRRSKKTGGGNGSENLSRVSIREHHAYNLMFNDGHMHPRDMADKLTKVWISPDFEIIARRKGHQCYTPCGGAKCSEERSYVAVAEKSHGSENTSSRPTSSPSPFDAEKLVSLTELALNVASKALDRLGSSR